MARRAWCAACSASRAARGVHLGRDAPAPPAPLRPGPGPIRQLFRELLEGGAGGLVRDTIPVHATGVFGYGVGRDVCLNGQPGQEAVHDRGKYLPVYRRQADGAWRIALDMFSSDRPAADTRRRERSG